MQKTIVKVFYRKIVYVKVESSLTKMSENVHWSNDNAICLIRRNFIGIARSQPNDILST